MKLVQKLNAQTYYNLKFQWKLMNYIQHKMNAELRKIQPNWKSPGDIATTFFNKWIEFSLIVALHGLYCPCYSSA